ncbi:hypothetical protein C8J56DRAFT_973192 [Mycena floridula]|nr:hypothetical protein C8J56DRAFT_973192 [Mycena floridula]
MPESPTAVASNECSLESTSGCCPVEDCRLTVDLSLLSSDGVNIGAHKANMGLFSEGFPTVDALQQMSVPGLETVSLDETGVILKLLVQFLHLQPLPECSDIDFNTLLKLAYAAEKYLVYSAMLLCKLKFSDDRLYKIYPAQVLSYATRHRYTALADQVAPWTRDVKAKWLFETSQENVTVLAAWTLYHEHQADVKVQYIASVSKFGTCKQTYCRNRPDVTANFRSLWNFVAPTSISLATAFNGNICSACSHSLSATPGSSAILTEAQTILRTLRPFSSFMKI